MKFNKLTPTERNVLHAYTMRDLYDINRNLFGMKKGGISHLSEIQTYEALRLKRVLEKLPCFHGDVHRGMNFPNKESLDDFIWNFKQGLNPLTGFISTSFNQEKPYNYFQEDKQHLMIYIENSTKGHYIGHLSSTPFDEEILYDCNQRFQMTDAEWKDENGIIHIKLKEI